MDKVIYLHIGTSKTGTTSIQNCLYNNRKLLAKKGYCFRRMPIIYERANKNRNGLFLGGLRRLPLVGRVSDEFRDKILNMGLKQVKTWLKHYTAVILTDESLWNQFHHNNFINLKKFKAFADKNDAQLKLVVYFRPQEDWLESRYKQLLIKPVKSEKNLPEWKEYVKHPELWPKLDYYEGLFHMSEIVGKDNIIVRVYDRKEFIEGKAEYDFLQAIGLEPTEEYKFAAEEKNTSLSPNYIEIKRILNNLEGIKNISLNDLDYVQTAAKKCSKSTKKLRKSSKETFISADERAMIRDLYEEGNKKLLKEYLPDREELFPDPKDTTVWSKDNPDLYEDTVLLFGYMLLDQEREINRLKRTVYLRLKFIDKCKAFFDKIVHHFTGEMP